MFYPPPFYGYVPPSNANPSPSDLERGMKIAMRLRQKEDRAEEKKKEKEQKRKIEERKKAEESKHRTLTAIEWYILGIVSYPFVGPAYNYLIHLAK